MKDRTPVTVVFKPVRGLYYNQIQRANKHHKKCLLQLRTERSGVQVLTPQPFKYPPMLTVAEPSAWAYIFVNASFYVYLSPIRFIIFARYPAPKPLSIFTTLTPLAQEFSIDRSADRPPNDAP